MIFTYAFVSVCLLSFHASDRIGATQLNLCETVGQLWKLKSDISIPLLQEFTVCFSVKFMQNPSQWTAFIYRHPDTKKKELGLEGNQSRIVVWLFEREWTTTSDIELQPSQWHSLCLTWSHEKENPSLYVNGTLKDLETNHNVACSFTSYDCSRLAPNGMLTLGDTYSGLIITLFQMWGQERNKRKVQSLFCTEGDVLKWERDSWRTDNKLHDTSLQCEWSDYEVKMVVDIKSGGNCQVCKKHACNWLRKVLEGMAPRNINLKWVSVSEVNRSSCVDTSQCSCKVPRKRTNIHRFQCSAHATVPSGINVTAMQKAIYEMLMPPCHKCKGQRKLRVLKESICITPVEKEEATMSTTTTSFTSFTSSSHPVTSTFSSTTTTQTSTSTTAVTSTSTSAATATATATATTITTSSTNISAILKCKEEAQQTRKGLFEWPVTTEGQNATQPCPKNPSHNATRHCKSCHSPHWLDSDLDECAVVVETIPDLEHIEVTAENAPGVVEIIKDLLLNQSTIVNQDLGTILNKLADAVNVSVVTQNLGQALINVISDILESDSNLMPFTNNIVNITEAVGDKITGYEGSCSMAAQAIAISVVDIVPSQFSTLSFGVMSRPGDTVPEIFFNSYPFNNTVAFITLPPTLKHSFPPDQSPPRIQFQFYGIPMLFKNFQSNQKDRVLNSFVVSASVTNASSPIKDLDEDIRITLHHLTPNTLHKDTQCVFWNSSKNSGHGDWDNSGCREYNSSSNYTTCLCDHLTHFGVLLDVSRTPVDSRNEQILTVITYLGCGVSSLFLGITVLTYTVFKKLRRDYPSQILINLCLALLGLNLIFLANSWLSSWDLDALCVAAAFTLHYFLLASFTWMGLEAINMYLALVKVFNIYVPSYILKACAVGWGLPLMICVIVLSVDREVYGNLHDSQPGLHLLENNFCWLQDNVTFYVSVVAYAVLVLLFNNVVFVVVLIQIRKMRINSPAGAHSGLKQDLKGVASLTLLLGLTWTAGFFTWGPARVFQLYLFSLLNTLQGLFIFLFHCLMKENVRKQWRIHLCFGHFRLDKYSEWSNSPSGETVVKPRLNPSRQSIPSVDSVKSSSTESTSASSDSSQKDSSCKRPNLGLFVNFPGSPSSPEEPCTYWSSASTEGDDSNTYKRH